MTSDRKGTYAGAGGYGFATGVGEILERRERRPRRISKKKDDKIDINEFSRNAKLLLNENLLAFNNITSDEKTGEEFTEHYERVRETNKIKRYNLFKLSKNEVSPGYEQFDQIVKKVKTNTSNVFDVRYDQTINMLIREDILPVEDILSAEEEDYSEVEDRDEAIKNLFKNILIDDSSSEFGISYFNYATSNNINPELLALTIAWTRLVKINIEKGDDTTSFANITKKINSKKTSNFIDKVIENKIFSTTEIDKDKLILNLLIYVNWVISLK